MARTNMDLSGSKAINENLRLEIRLFGPLELRIDGHAVPEIRSRKAHWLLALLALRQGQEIERSWLAGTLWPECDAARAYANLRQSLADLRRALGSAETCLHSSTNQTLSLQVPPETIDSIDFKAAIAVADETSLLRAVSLYRGPLLEGCAEEWVVQEREAFSQSYLDALDMLAEFAMKRCEYAVAVMHLRRVVSVDPLRECSQRALMQSLSKCGDYAAAIQVYRDLRLLLHGELNTEPDPETIALFTRIRDSAADRARTAGGPESPYPLRPAGRIPRPVSEIVGREKECTEIKARLQSARLVTLTGSGGIGKTRLAIQVAENSVDEFAGGVWFVELASVSDPDLVPQAVASAMGVREAPGGSIAQSISSFIGGMRLLLVLDNCEHLLASCSNLAGFLLKECGQMHVLATSRQALGITGEIDWRVPSLSLPEPLAGARDEDWTPDTLAACEAVRLFVERASAARNGFALTNRNAASIARICRRLDGIPLAIELAAARIMLFSADQLDSRLSESFSLLVGAGKTTVPRHKTIRAAMEWSYDLLSDPERNLLRQLSVFAGSFTVEAIQAVGGDLTFDTDDELELLSALVDKSLVVVIEGIGDSNYRLLDITRAFARDLLARSGEEAQTCARHARYYLSLAEGAAAFLDSPHQAEYLDQLEGEQDNLRAALDWLNRPESTEFDLELNLKLCSSLARFWYIRGHLTESRRYLRRALERDSPRSLARAGALVSTGLDDLWAYERENARGCLQEALEIYQELGHQIGIAEAYYRLARMAQAEFKFDEAQSLYEKSLSVGRPAGYLRGNSECLTALGKIAQDRGDYIAASRFYEQALNTARQSTIRFAETRPLTNLGVAAYVRGDLEAARSFHMECLAINREMGAKSGTGWSLNNLGDVALAQGNLDEAQDYYLQSLAVDIEVDNVGAAAECLRGLAEIMVAQGVKDRLITAARLFGAAESIRESIGMNVHAPYAAGHERAVALARRNASETQFSEAWAKGKRIQLKQALDFAHDCITGG